MVNETVKAKGMVRSYEDAEHFLGGATRRWIAANTDILRWDKSLSHLKSNVPCLTVRYYDTDILTYYPDGTFSVDIPDYLTATTVCRLNQFGPERYRFYRCKRLLRISDGAHGSLVVLGKHYSCKEWDQ